MPRARSTFKLLTYAVCAAACIASFITAKPQSQTPANKTAAVYLCPMHPELQSTAQGRCPRCNMSLIKAEIDVEKLTYFCPKHPGIELKTPGVCWRCGQDLIIRAALPEYKIELSTTPTELVAGGSLQMSLRIVHPSTAETIRDLHVVHEKIFHLFVISEDLSEYQHLHPVQQPDGSLKVETTLPAAGLYHVFCDFLPVGGSPQLVRRTLITKGLTRKMPRKAANVRPDRVLTKVFDGVRVDLSFDPNQPTASTPITLKYRLSDAATGIPVTDLEPYLGAWGHTVVLSEDTRHYVHSHPKVMVPRSQSGIRLHNTPEISFDTYFPQPGRYRIWSQFQRHNRVTTVPFDVNIAKLESIARWNGQSWSPLTKTDTVLNGIVRAIAINRNGMYVGGDFREAGSLPAAGIARWNGRSWEPLGPGVNGTVWAIVSDGKNVYVGGEFTHAGATLVNGVAKWDGHRWSSLGKGIHGCRDMPCSPAVYALAVRGKQLYAGGRFTYAGSVAANGIGRWDGHRWENLGQGVSTGHYDGVIHALAMNDQSVYAGGSFKTAGDRAASNVAVWDGSRWSPLGPGIAGGLEKVLSLALRGTSLYAGGDFSEAGTISVSNAALWNGEQWSSLNLKPNGGIQKITVSGNEVYLSGATFMLPSGKPAKGVLRWNGSWSGLGEGVSNGEFHSPVTALAVVGSQVLAGGGPFALESGKSR